MATISSPRAKLTRTVSLAIFEDGSWKVISDLEPAEIKAQLDMAYAEVVNALERRAAGETDEDEDDADETAGVTVTTISPEVAPVPALGQV